MSVVMKKVTSSNIKSLGFKEIDNPESPNTGYLYVRFTNGAVYRYTDVPEAFLTVLLYINEIGGSVGKVFNLLIKEEGGFQYERLDK